jgi:hypothetical protein
MLKVISVSNIAEIKAEFPTSDNVIFKNPSKSIHYLGLGYLLALKNWLGENYAHSTFVCDCASSAALAHEAMNLGFKYVLFEGGKEYEQKLQDVARGLGAKLITDSVVN